MVMVTSTENRLKRELLINTKNINKNFSPKEEYYKLVEEFKAN